MNLFLKTIYVNQVIVNIITIMSANRYGIRLSNRSFLLRDRGLENNDNYGIMMCLAKEAKQDSIDSVDKMFHFLSYFPVFVNTLRCRINGVVVVAE